ncbi:hypothetical protein FRX31_027490 [Thalictrum thalictroides]|uniref:Uncharacterized protein n=1 Tax=Thalictrum thalictroides TaxID=46969 RepID=A0A7J6VF13_THATH|nr:hypothetical protein FRX31_027490 [Thalictrum thalictroides]
MGMRDSTIFPDNCTSSPRIGVAKMKGVTITVIVRTITLDRLIAMHVDFHHVVFLCSIGLSA